MYELFLPSHTPFGERAKNKHSTDCSLADLKGKSEQEGEGYGSDDEKRVTGDVELCKINSELAACRVVSALYGNLEGSQKI